VGGLSRKAHDRADMVPNSLEGRGGRDPLAIESHSLPGESWNSQDPLLSVLMAALKKHIAE
jgi:hypothetical protein